MTGPWRAFDAAWFARWQAALLLVLDEPLLGRWLRWVLAIVRGDPGYRGRIVRLLPHAYVVDAGGGRLVADFRTHPKYAKRIYHAFRPLWWACHWWDRLVAEPFVPAWDLGFSTLTAYPDAGDPGVTSCDGYISRDGVEESWATIRAGTGTSLDQAGSNVTLVSMKSFSSTDNWNELIRSVFLFDTSALTASAFVTAAVLSIYGVSKSDALGVSPDIDVYTSAPASNTALANGDFSTIGTTSQTGAPISYASFATAAYNDYTLNATGIGNVSKTGVSKYALRNANYDAANVAPTWASLLRSNFVGKGADEAGTGSDPKLVVTYTTTAVVTATDSGRVAATEGASTTVVGSAVTVTATESLRIATHEGAVATTATTKTATDPLAVRVSEAAAATSGAWLPASLRIDALLDGATWTELTQVYAGDPVEIRYGIAGTGPMDNLAGTGTATFSVLNDAAGTWSPSSASATAGWAPGLRIRIAFESGGGGDRVKFYGKVGSLIPDPGLYGPRRVRVLVYDFMKDLAEASLRQVAAQINQTDRDAIVAVLAALPAESAPPAVSLDAAIDTYPVAFDEVGDGASAMGLIKDVLDSTFGLYAQRGDGTHVYINRETRTFAVSRDTFTAADFAPGRVEVPSDLATLYNRVIVERPNVVVGTTNEVLASEPGTDSEGVAAGETVERWLTYRDPNDTSTDPVGLSGTDFAAGSPVSGTDFVYNASPDGLGANVTASMTVTADYFSGAAKFTITNGSGATAYRITLQVRGKAIRRYKPTTVESVSTQSYAQRTLRVRGPFQDSTTVAQFVADYVRGQYEGWTQRPVAVEIVAGLSDRLMRHAIEREPGDRITLAETVTGLAADAIIKSVGLTVRQTARGVWVRCTWGLAPQSSFNFISPWLLETAGRGELGDTTVLA